MTDLDKTIVPRREHISSKANDVTMPGKRDRKPDGRFAVGDLIMGRYKVLAELGQGGMGVVYKCFDETAGIEIALKALPPELSHNTLEMEDIKDNFQLVSKLVHQNIAISKQLERDDSNGNYYLIMECCEGEDLRHWLRRKRKEGELKLEDVLPIVQQVAEALDYAHEMKIIHRDIKPGNIMIDNLGKIKVLDFGLAAQIHTSMTRVSMAYHGTSGTGAYMAPEQWEGRIQDAKADQYALAVMTYEMLAGHTPFESTDAAVLREAVLKSKVIPLENISSSANAAVMRALSKDPAERFENCSDFASALGGKKIKATKTVKKGRFSKWIAAIIVLVLLCTGGTGYYFFDKQQKEKARLAEEKLLAEERARKLAEEKRIAEEKEKARQAKLTEEQLDSENSALKVELTEKIAEISRKNYDPAQTFGEKTREMKTAFAVAQEAKLLSSANKEYKKAQKLADWILTNGELRKEVLNLKLQAENNKNAADKYGPQTFAAKLYSSAGNAYSQAMKCYNDLKFAEAKKHFAESAKGFKIAGNTAFDNKLQFLKDKAKDCEKNSKWTELKVWAEKIRPLNSALAGQFTAKADNELKKIAVEKQLKSARSAQAEKNWQRMLDYAVAALNIDSGNAEAQRLKQEAEKLLIPELKIIATINNKKIPGQIILEKNKFSTDSIIKGLKKSQKYQCYIVGLNDYQRFSKFYEFTCDWNGIKEIYVKLESLDEIINNDQKRGVKFSNDYKVLIKVPSNISGYIIPFGITTIEAYAFSACKNLECVVIPASVTVFNEGTLPAQKIVSNNANFYVDNNGLFIDKKSKKILSLSSSFSGDLLIPGNITNIGEHAFRGCKNLTSVTIPASVLTIGDGAFSSCTNLKGVNILGKDTVLGKYVFSDCKNLVDVKLPSSMKIVNEGLFHSCEQIKRIDLPSNITTIKRTAFANCSNLTDITLPNGLSNIGGSAFSGCKKLSTINLPNTISGIDEFAFAGSGLLNINLPQSMFTIEKYMFSDCAQLVNVNIPEGIEYIYKSAFSRCSKLTSITLPNSIKKVDEWAFYGCQKLNKITIPRHLDSEVQNWYLNSNCKIIRR